MPLDRCPTPRQLAKMLPKDNCFFSAENMATFGDSFDNYKTKLVLIEGQQYVKLSRKNPARYGNSSPVYFNTETWENHTPSDEVVIANPPKSLGEVLWALGGNYTQRKPSRTLIGTLVAAGR